MQNSSAVTFADIYQPTAQLLGASGSIGYWHAESFALAANEGDPQFYFAPSISQITSNYSNVVFPGGASYVPLSLFTLDATELYLPTTASPATDNTLLTDLYNTSNIVSTSWSLHIGSYAQKINGSLIIGGYDQSRLIEGPGAYSSSGIELSGISLGASTGGYDWTTSQLNHNYLNDSTLNVSITPSVPYLYLPASVCSALAEDLPISYNASFNVFEWDTEDPSYAEIVTSPSFLNFTFSGGNGQDPISIRVPFALLNLTLDAPLVGNPVSYFPCAPSNPAPFALGRAFLQAALIGQNQNSSTFWLAQAPGPNGLSSTPAIKIINPSDADLVPDPAGTTWEDSWRDVLKPISGAAASMSRPNYTRLTDAAIAGIVVGAVALVVGGLAIWLCLRRRQRRRRQSQPAAAPQWPAPYEKPKYWPAQEKDHRILLVEAPSPSSTPYQKPEGWLTNKKDRQRSLVEAPSPSAASELAGHKLMLFEAP